MFNFYKLYGRKHLSDQFLEHRMPGHIKNSSITSYVTSSKENQTGK